MLLRADTETIDLLGQLEQWLSGIIRQRVVFVMIAGVWLRVPWWTDAHRRRLTGWGDVLDLLVTMLGFDAAIIKRRIPHLLSQWTRMSWMIARLGRREIYDLSVERHERSATRLFGCREVNYLTAEL